jgi:aspartyl-tRNA(Asn)/glutamyl-tRNA(Gln) amidotransferase subunit B
MDQSIRDKYQAVIGLEVHAQLLTESKAYSSESTEYGSLPNTNISVITLAHPGALPKANKKVLEYAIRMGLACKSEITRYNLYDRKNYFYPDLPKGYQITQDKTPICVGGHIDIKTKDGQTRSIGITRIHMEEDAGKSMHLAGETESLIDLNRAGVPLIEIVSEPEIRTSDEAYAYVTEIRKLVRYLDICDGNMEEGSLRCDANISVMLKGAAEFGKKVEVKNMNSIRNVQRAIEHEIERQILAIEAGKTIVSETRTFDATTGLTHSMRTKEDLNDYRYFPEPDLQPVVVTDEMLKEIEASLPSLPQELYQKFTGEFGLPEYDASVLTDNRDIALYFEELCRQTSNYKAASNWVMGPIKSYLNELTLPMSRFPIAQQNIAQLITLVDEGKVSYSVASQKIFAAMLENPSKTAVQIAEELNLMQNSDESSLQAIIDEVLAKNPAKVAEYKGGKKGILGMFMGEVMKASKGKADPKLTNALLAKALD